MRAEEIRALDLLGAPDERFVIPPYQRVYSWTAGECSTLFEDILSSGESGRPHFAGIFLCTVAQEDDGSLVRIVIDGQQRITTLTLLLIALRNKLMEKAADEHDLKAVSEALTRDYLLSSDGLHPKLQLTSMDAQTLEYELGIIPEPEELSSRIMDNLALLREKMADPRFDAALFWKGLALLQLVAIELDENDSPQDVFESLNSKGKLLAIQDLVRNSLLMSLDGASEAEAVYERSWLPLEQTVDGIKAANMDDVICAWMASNHEDDRITSKSDVYPLLQRDLSQRFGGSYEDLLTDLRSYAEKLGENDQFKRDQLHDARLWVEGKPRKLISDYKIFGD